MERASIHRAIITPPRPSFCPCQIFSVGRCLFSLTGREEELHCGPGSSKQTFIVRSFSPQNLLKHRAQTEHACMLNEYESVDRVRRRQPSLFVSTNSNCGAFHHIRRSTHTSFVLVVGGGVHAIPCGRRGSPLSNCINNSVTIGGFAPKVTLRG